MAIAISWIQYENASPFAPINSGVTPPDLPALDLGDATVNTWGNKAVVGLRIQGSNVKNIHMWMDGEQADRYLTQGTEPELRIDLGQKGYIFKNFILNDVSKRELEPCTIATIADIALVPAPAVIDNH